MKENKSYLHCYEHIISDLYSQLHGVQGGAGAVEVHPGVTRLVGDQPAVPAHVGLSAQPQGDQARAGGAHAAPENTKLQAECYHDQWLTA